MGSTASQEKDKKLESKSNNISSPTTPQTASTTKRKEGNTISKTKTAHQPREGTAEGKEASLHIIAKAQCKYCGFLYLKSSCMIFNECSHSFCRDCLRNGIGSLNFNLLKLMGAENEKEGMVPCLKASCSGSMSSSVVRELYSSLDNMPTYYI